MCYGSMSTCVLSKTWFKSVSAKIALQNYKSDVNDKELSINFAMKNRISTYNPNLKWCSLLITIVLGTECYPAYAQTLVGVINFQIAIACPRACANLRNGVILGRL